MIERRKYNLKNLQYYMVIVFIAIIFVFSGCAGRNGDFTNIEKEAKPDGNTEYGIIEIYIFGIGRSDAILVMTENHTLMIDTGENKDGSYIVEYLLNRDIALIDYLIITHFDSDHVGGAHIIINNVDVENVIIPNYSRESRHVERFEKAMGDAGIIPFILTETIYFTLDDAKFMVNPSQSEYYHFACDSDEDDDLSEDNEEAFRPPVGDDFSIIVSMNHGENNFLFTGDAVAGRLNELLENNEIMSTDYDFLKVPRHGRHNKRSVEFLHAISPQYAVITGFAPELADVFYPERPADERVVHALEDVGAEILFTMSDGVQIKCDGIRLIIISDNNSARSY